MAVCLGFPGPNLSSELYKGQVEIAKDQVANHADE
jgi:hypothetical protein